MIESERACSSFFQFSYTYNVFKVAYCSSWTITDRMWTLYYLSAVRDWRTSPKNKQFKNKTNQNTHLPSTCEGFLLPGCQGSVLLASLSLLSSLLSAFVNERPSAPSVWSGWWWRAWCRWSAPRSSPGTSPSGSPASSPGCPHTCPSRCRWSCAPATEKMKKMRISFNSLLNKSQ